MKLRATVCAAMGLLGGCGGQSGGAIASSASDAPAAPDWRMIATNADRRRLRDWREAWTNALARLPGDKRVAALGALLAPDAALEDPMPPLGDYRCRVIKLGAKQPGMLDYVAYPYFRCQIATTGHGRTLVKLDGSQRPVGMLYRDSPTRLIFLGSMVLGDEQRAIGYGRDPERDMIGLVERIGQRQWRLVLPSPRWESLIDVMELVPAD